MIDQLFGSKTRVKLLYLFYGNPNRSFYVREITRKIDEQINSVRRELSNLLNTGIIKSDSSNNKLYYEINQTHEFYKPLRTIFSSKSSTKSNLFSPQEKKFREIGKVKLVYLLGKFVRDTNAPADLLLVGDVNRNKLVALVEAIEKEEGFEITYSSMSEDDYRYRLTVKDRFLTQIDNSKKTVIVDELTTENKEEGA